jgi:hypothetical protein
MVVVPILRNRTRASAASRGQAGAKFESIRQNRPADGFAGARGEAKKERKCSCQRRAVYLIYAFRFAKTGKRVFLQRI